MQLELLKLIVQPVVLERDDEGKVTGERLGDARPLYGREQVIEYLDGLEAQLAEESA